jgi:predicted  nucleic acid-binding Zn-ribbon protein
VVHPGPEREEPPLNADPSDQLRLLDVQELDAKADLLAHRAQTLPQRAEADRLAAELAMIGDRVVVVETEVSDIEREVAKAEADVEQVRQRAARDRSRLDAGVGTAKELESLQHEMTSLARRQSELEDLELEVMERLETAQTALSEIAAERNEKEARRQALDEEAAALLADLDRDRAYALESRAAVVAGIPADLVALYEKIRARENGVGAAALHQRRCQGCRLELTASDVSRLRDAAPDEVLRCEQCQRILVRTSESGL